MATRKTPSTAQVTPKRSAARNRKRQSIQQPDAGLVRSQRAPPPHSKPVDFPIVGVGASAGGLEAIEELFAHMPADNGMAFVVVTHQSPHHVSLLPEILGKYTSMRVLEAVNGMPIEPNCIYIAPPNRYLSILHATLHLLEAASGAAIRLPIDAFFRALAVDQGDRAVCIVLSGTATDGTLGLRAIKGVSGMTIVQEPQSAKYDGMPRSALATGLVDYVLTPSDMPAQLLAYMQGLPLSRRVPELRPALSQMLQRIFILLRDRTGHDFSGYKATTLHRCIARRMNVHQITAPGQYVRLLQEQPHELDLLGKELLIGVTHFFRDPEVFDMLANKVLSQLLAAKADHEVIRVWVPGCSTGEEAYSLGILFQESLERLGRQCKVQIFATDLDSQGIEAARTGLYPEGIAIDVRPDRLARFFTKEDAHYRIAKVIRDMVIFAPHNLISAPPFTKLDLLSCRNLLIYLNAALQKQLLPMFHYALRPHGLLFLGASETINGLNDLFEVIDKRWKLFRRKDTATVRPVLANFSLILQEQKPVGRHTARMSGLEPASRLEPLIEKLLVARYAPPSIIINDRGDIVYIHGSTGAYLEPTPGQPRLNILAMARAGLRLPLATALSQAASREVEVVHQRVQVKTNGDTVLVNVTVQKLADPEPVRGLLRVSFEPVADVMPPPQPGARGRVKPAQQDRVAELEQELQHTQEALQKATEELESSYEEFQSTNEEVQSANEELQSTNEELESAKEELQSLNEELQMVNTELQNKVETLSQVHDDMTNLLNSLEIAIIFLDTNLHIKRFTSQAREICNLIQSDVGRPISDMVTNLQYTSLVQDAQEVLRTLVCRESEVQAKTGTWYLMRMRPYRTAQNAIDGLILTFVDITRLKDAEVATQTAEEARTYAEGIVETVREPLVILDTELHVVSANQAFYRSFHVVPQQTESQLLYALGNSQWDIPPLRQLLTDVLLHHTTFQDFKVEHDFPDIGHKVMLLNARRIERLPGKPSLILLAIEDVTTRQRQEET